MIPSSGAALAADPSFLSPSRRALLLLLILFLSGGCLTVRPRSRKPSSSAVIIPDMAIRRWGDNSCGSGALSTLMNHFGDPVTEDELNRTLDKGLHGGVISIDLLLETRRRGFDGQLVPGSAAILREAIARQVPAILLVRVLDLPGRREDFYHYIIVDGYDASRDLFRTQFGDGKARWIKLSSIDPNWRAGGRATLLVRGKSEHPASVEETLRRAVALEEKGERGAAIAIYRDLLQRDASSALIWTNLANALAAEGQNVESAKAYQRAIELTPANRDALNNYAWLLYQEKNLDEAKAIALRAVAAAGPDPYAAQQTLGDILAARHECEGALAAYRAAFDVVPSEQPQAKAAILLGMGRAQLGCGAREAGRHTLTLALQLQPDAATASEIQKLIDAP